MSSLDKQERTQEEIASTLQEILKAFEVQHTDNEKLQKRMLWATYVMAAATAIMTGATVVIAIAEWTPKV